MHPLFLFLWLFFTMKLSDSAASMNIESTVQLPEYGANYGRFSISVPLSSCSTLQNFNCRCGEDALAVRCSGVDFAEVAPNIPNVTVHLEITDSPLQAFAKPLLSHLHNLRYLKLSHNAHRYITSKAFQGLGNLEVLDLSFNDIIVLSKAFMHTPKLQALNLTSNQVINIKTIATSLSHLQNFRNLSLNHNVRIRKILSDELLPLSNTTLVKLEIFNTTIKIIEEQAFKPLRHLKVLELSVNYMNEIGLQNVTADLGNTSIEMLLLRSIDIQRGLPHTALSLLRNTSVLHLDMGYNYFRKLSKFPPIPSLISLWLPFCTIQGLDENAFDNLPNLRLLELGNNQIISLYGTMSLPKLKYLSLKNQNQQNDDNLRLSFDNFSFRNMTGLVMLDLTKIGAEGKISNYTFDRLTSLMQLHLSSNRIDQIEDYAFETMGSLQKLVLSNNELSVLTNRTFFGLRKLRELFLSHNNIKFESAVYPFQNSPSLSILVLNSNQIVEIPENMFSGLLRLNTLVLFANKVLPWNSRILSNQSNVSTLLLSHNKIWSVTAAMIDDFSLVNNTLDITDNPFNCSACGMKQFQQFLNETSATLSYSSGINVNGTYICSDPKNLSGQSLLEVDIPTQHCLNREINMAIFITTLILSVIFPAILISVFCYVFRWYIRYWLFHMEASLKERKHSSKDTKRYLYDAFVSYNATDTPWVRDTLIPALEEQDPRLKLCIHERDFEVGRLITDNILDTIEVSRKVILLLSESFLTSEWCMFELHMAQHKLFDETRDVLILVKLKNIDKKFYTKNMRYLEKTRTCLSWTEHPVGQKLFWDKMRKALSKPSTDSKRAQDTGLPFTLKV